MEFCGEGGRTGEEVMRGGVIAVGGGVVLVVVAPVAGLLGMALLGPISCVNGGVVSMGGGPS